MVLSRDTEPVREGLRGLTAVHVGGSTHRVECLTHVFEREAFQSRAFP